MHITSTVITLWKWLIGYNLIKKIKTNSIFNCNTGVTTFLDIDECQSQACQHGSTCVDEVNGYNCVCDYGWTGILCQTGNIFVMVWQVFLLHGISATCIYLFAKIWLLEFAT